MSLILHHEVVVAMLYVTPRLMTARWTCSVSHGDLETIDLACESHRCDGVEIWRAWIQQVGQVAWRAWIQQVGDLESLERNQVFS